MLKRFIILFFLVAWPLLAFGQDLPQAPDDPLQNATVAFDGQWLPDRDPAEIGANNFKTLQNMRYRPGGIEGILGYSKINTTALSPATYPYGRSGFHFKKDHPSESHVLYHADNSPETASVVWENSTAIPSQGDFSATVMHTDATGAGLGRFSTAPDGMTYCNEKECLSWAGDEMPIAGFFSLVQISNAYADVDFDTTADTITDAAGGDFVASGYQPGQTIAITDSTLNDGTFTIEKIDNSVATNDRLTVTENVSTDTDESPTVAATISTGGYKNIVDYTVAVLNTLQTEGNVAHVSQGSSTDTLLLLHADGADGSTTFTDSGLYAHTVTANGNAQIDTAQKKWTASGLFDGTGDYISIPDDHGVTDYWHMGTGSFSVEFWIRPNSLPADGDAVGLWQQAVDQSNRVVCYLTNLSGSYYVYLQVEDGGSLSTVAGAPANDIAVGSWGHVCCIRGFGGTANEWYVLWNGNAFIPTPEYVDDWPDLDAPLEIGRFTGGTGTTKYFDGHIDEFRFASPAKRTTTFTPQSQPFPDSSDTWPAQWLLLTTRPTQGFKYYIDSANTTTSTLTGKVWAGSDFSDISLADNTASDGVSMAATGTVTFDSTVNIAKPLHFEGAYLYAYLFSMSAGEAGIYHVTADAPFQPIVNVWDEVNRLPIMFQFYDQSVPAYDDFTVAVSKYSGAEGTFGADIDDMTSSDHIIIMFEERMAGIFFTMSSSGEANVNDAIPDIEYHNGTEWVSVGTITDGTSEDANDWGVLGQSGLMSWNPPGEYIEVEQTLFGVTGYAYRFTVSAALDATVTIDAVFGVPAQSAVMPFKFPAKFKDRTLLCGFTEGNEGNRIDFSMPGTSDVWNGELSSMDGIYSIRVPGQGDLTCGTELYNRYGSNVFAFFLAFKNTETHVIAGDHPTGENEFKVFPVSTTIGCPAPLTLATAEVGYEMAEGVGRQMAFWVSTAGPMKFDGGVMSPLVDADGNGVQTFFDPASSDCITFANIADARGWYDSTYAEYNIVFPGDSLWLVYDLIEKKWYRKVPATYPKCGFPVYDTNGVQYIYAGFDTGYMMRLENGYTWDGTGIAQTVETGDFFPSKDSWHKTRLRQFKVAVKDTPGVAENTGDYTEVDGAGRVALTNATTITVTDLDQDEEAWVVKDMGIDYFEEDFGFHVDVKCTANNDAEDRCVCWAVTNIVDTLADIVSAFGDWLAVYWHNDGAGADKLRLARCYGGTISFVASDALSVGTQYYLKIVRDGTVGTYGTLYLYIYSDETHTTLVDSVSLALAAKQDFRYLYWMNSDEHDQAGAAWDGVISNFRVLGNLATTHYADTATSGTSLTALNLSSGSNRIGRDTQACNLLGWSHRVKFEATTNSTTTRRVRLLVWAYQWQYVRDDL